MLSAFQPCHMLVVVVLSKIEGIVGVAISTSFPFVNLGATYLHSNCDDTKRCCIMNNLFRVSCTSLVHQFRAVAGIRNHDLLRTIRLLPVVFFCFFVIFREAAL